MYCLLLIIFLQALNFVTLIDNAGIIFIDLRFSVIKS